MCSLCPRRSSSVRALLAILLAAGVAQAQPDAGAILGRVLLNNGNPVSRGKLRLDGPGKHVEMIADSSGTYRFGGLVPGTYRITFTDLDVRTIEVDLASGEHLEIPDVMLSLAGSCQQPAPFYFKLLRPLTRAGAVSGSISGWVSGEIALYNPQERYRTVRPDSNGDFEIGNLQAGTYRLWIHKDGLAGIFTREFDLQPGWEAVYSPPPPYSGKPFVCE